MAAIALEEKINKIRLQNEEIRRRHEEVEADKKNAAKLNALVQMVPSSDWPERKEPPEFQNVNRPSSQPKTKLSPKEHYYAGMEGKTMHKFADGDGPPPDPKYNFLADSERDNSSENPKEDEKKKDRNRFSRGGGSGNKKRGGGKDSFVKHDYHAPHVPFKKEAPEYEAWKAERNRIDEARINRQKTAAGNWRREWDNNKTEFESARKDIRMRDEDITRDKDYDKRYHHNGENSNYGRINDQRTPHSSFKSNKGMMKESYGTNVFQQQQNHSRIHQTSHALGNNSKTINDISRNTKPMLNRGLNVPKGPVMSVKVNSPSIAGTGRVGPRQKTRVTYSTVSEGDVKLFENDRSSYFDDRHSEPKLMQPKSPYAQRKKDQSYMKNEPWKSEKVLVKKEFKDVTKSYTQVGKFGSQGRIERVRSDNAQSLELNVNANKVVDAANKLENEIKVVSEAEQFHVKDDNIEKDEIVNNEGTQRSSEENNDEDVDQMKTDDQIINEEEKFDNKNTSDESTLLSASKAVDKESLKVDPIVNDVQFESTELSSKLENAVNDSNEVDISNKNIQEETKNDELKAIDNIALNEEIKHSDGEEKEQIKSFDSILKDDDKSAVIENK